MHPQWVKDRCAGRNPTFHPFPRLPAELRIKIWKLSFLPKCITFGERRPRYSYGYGSNGLYKFAKLEDRPLDPDDDGFVPLFIRKWRTFRVSRKHGPNAEDYDTGSDSESDSDTYETRLSLFSSEVLAWVNVEARSIFLESYNVLVSPGFPYGNFVNWDIDTACFRNIFKEWQVLIKDPKYHKLLDKIQLLHFYELSNRYTRWVPHVEEQDDEEQDDTLELDHTDSRNPYDFTLLKSLRELSFQVDYEAEVNHAGDFESMVKCIQFAADAGTWNVSRSPKLSALMLRRFEGVYDEYEWGDMSHCRSAILYTSGSNLKSGNYGCKAFKPDYDDIGDNIFPEKCQIEWITDLNEFLDDGNTPWEEYTLLAKLIRIVKGKTLVETLESSDSTHIDDDTDHSGHSDDSNSHSEDGDTALTGHIEDLASMTISQ